jgi:hypothetical protein
LCGLGILLRLNSGRGGEGGGSEQEVPSSGVGRFGLHEVPFPLEVRAGILATNGALRRVEELGAGNGD